MADGMFSLRELYRIGRGPSSSHTMGPEAACLAVRRDCPEATRFAVTLYGSLAKTGIGHRTDKAIRCAFEPLPVDIDFDTETDKLPHPNTMRIIAFCGDDVLCDRLACSVGGGAIHFADEEHRPHVPVYPEHSFAQIRSYCEEHALTLPGYVELREGAQIREYLAEVLAQMKKTVAAGLGAEGVIPGGLGIMRRAGLLHKRGAAMEFGHEKEIYLLSAYAYAASEENACGETVVTAPTCGSAGVLPAVLLFKQRERGYSDEEVISALEVAALVGNLIKANASLSGAECGCQAEVGSACAMAAAAYAYLKGLGWAQIECAAEIAIEHHLGLTCDPVLGLVQIPCIERNAVAAMRAVDAVSLAEMLYGQRKISLDLVIKTMYETGRDLSCRYRETSDGGLAALYDTKKTPM